MRSQELVEFLPAEPSSGSKSVCLGRAWGLPREARLSLGEQDLTCSLGGTEVELEGPHAACEKDNSSSLIRMK